MKHEFLSDEELAIIRRHTTWDLESMLQDQGLGSQFTGGKSRVRMS